ncbi:MAG: hypothetical protein A2W31_09895 [Planctomycetes bacterium RBG_16_64_10]|nr:MAG: hypothetical protein A2W31_09895 [Planctomycetes bacterium RBG_16_64_10]
MQHLPMWLLTSCALLVVWPAQAQYPSALPAGGHPGAGLDAMVDGGYPVPMAEGGYLQPMVEKGYPPDSFAESPGYEGTDADCDGGACGTGRTGWCACPDRAGGGRMRRGWIRGGLNQMCRCAAARAYMVPVGPRDETGCPSCGGGPYQDGTCAVHWFDVYADFLYLKREDVARTVDFTSDGIQGPIVLSTDSLGFDEEPGFRLTGTWQISASSHLEATYLGTFNWHSNAVATSNTNNLYSVLSDFGTLPPDGWLQTDQAAQHWLDYSSDLHNIELNWRQHWVGPNYWFQGSFMMGVRYVRLREDLSYLTQVNAHVDPNPPPVAPELRGPASMNYQVGTRNHLVGFQLGSDLFACVLPGLMLGGDLKAGIYGNHARQKTTVDATDLVPDLFESASDDEAALVAEGSVMVLYQFRPWLSLRGGYELLYLDGVALAPENFNAVAPFPPLNASRSVQINVNGDAFYHGLTAGLEWLW